MVMLNDTDRADGSPFTLPGPVLVYVVVDDPDALHDRAVAAGAEIVSGLTDQDYGSREFAARDPHGNVWSFGTYRPSPQADAGAVRRGGRPRPGRGTSSPAGRAARAGRR